MVQKYEFDVALSFAGEDREFIEKVALWLKEMNLKVFYDKYEAISLWGKDLYEHLYEIYNKRAKYTVMFISKNYADKLWTNHERKSAQARAFSEKQEYILPARFDDTEIPGLMKTIGYINLTGLDPKYFAEMIKEKVGPIDRFDFLPKEIDRLLDYVSEEKDEEEIYNVAMIFFDVLKLMTHEERKILANLACNACPAGTPENLHINIDYFSRILSMTKEEIMSIFSRLDCLGFKSRLYEEKDLVDEDSLTKSREALEVKFFTMSVDDDDNATFIICSIFDCIYDHLCSHCAENALKKLDFSILSTLVGFSEKEK